MKDVFKKKYLEYEPKITLEIFTLVWNRLIELGYKSFNNATIEERYDKFKGRYSYFRTTQNHPKEFNCYNNGEPYSKTTVEEILGYNPFIKETKPSKNWNKVTEEELLEEAKRRYPIGCKVKLIGLNVGGDFKNEVRFTTYKSYNYSKGKQLFVDGNLLLFHEGIWAEIESIPEVEVKDETKEAFDSQNKDEEKFQFIVGKWYKCESYDCIIKYFGIKKSKNGDAILYSDLISCGRSYKSCPEGDVGVGYTTNKYWYELTDLSEIQQYLPEGHPDKISSAEDTGILNESSIGKYVSFNYREHFYDKAFIIKENDYIYLLNNCHSNNNGHKDKSIYKYSLKFRNFKEAESLCKEIKFLITEEVPKLRVQELTPGYLDWEVVPKKVTKLNEIEFTYLPEPN